MSSPITDEIAAKDAIYAMLACNCYHEKSKTHFPVEKLDWILVDRDGHPTDEPSKQGWFTGFAYDIYENSKSNKSVIAFRGTDSKQDWITSNFAIPFSIPYKSAIKAVRQYVEKNGSRDLVVIGHSLGGGLALSASVHQGVPAITFDPSPRIFDGLGDHHEPALRVIIYQKAEILEKLREKWDTKAYDVVKSEDVYECNYNFGENNDHRIDILAENLAKQGVRSNPKLQPILDALPAKPIP
ncbi:Mbeg1-like protein [Methylobacter tundripaludum]|uniref:Mbeg1-like protein n=1 Tax=Methylobacter tundripaludum TaxID=173365 RepID=UPI0004DF040B|nr:Mbeg1-like protein [Methylobacter tundripaludum]